ncbi:MAG: hypothetical protein RQM92_02825 [Candidatus Syntrophopropionicum ammoniitolerans]
MQQITAEKDWGFLDLRLLLLNPIDLRGIPYPNRMTRQADWLTPSFLPHVRRDGLPRGSSFMMRLLPHHELSRLLPTS